MNNSLRGQDRAGRVNTLARDLYETAGSALGECEPAEVMAAMLLAAGQAIHALGVTDVYVESWRNLILEQIALGVETASSGQDCLVH